jgi:hypothetical protein
MELYFDSNLGRRTRQGRLSRSQQVGDIGTHFGSWSMGLDHIVIDALSLGAKKDIVKKSLLPFPSTVRLVKFNCLLL